MRREEEVVLVFPIRPERFIERFMYSGIGFIFAVLLHEGAHALFCGLFGRPVLEFAFIFPTGAWIKIPSIGNLYEFIIIAWAGVIANLVVAFLLRETASYLLACLSLHSALLVVFNAFPAIIMYNPLQPLLLALSLLGLTLALVWKDWRRVIGFIAFLIFGYFALTIAPISAIVVNDVSLIVHLLYTHDLHVLAGVNALAGAICSVLGGIIFVQFLRMGR